MLILTISAVILLNACGDVTSTDVLETSRYDSAIDGWLVKQKVQATWEWAFKQCQQQGAVLAAPTTSELLTAMLSITGDTNRSYHIGITAMLDRETFVSIEGIPLDRTPTTHMYEELNPADGLCLSINQDRINPVPCSQRLSYMCYKKRNHQEQLTDCGTFDKGYKLVPETGSCYKFHTWKRWWDQYATCINEGGYLAVINDEKEANIVKNLNPFPSFPTLISLRDMFGDGNWMSLHGHTIDQIYNVWEKNTMPQNKCCDCGTITHEGNLRAYDCATYKFISVCEKDPSVVKFLPGDQ